MDGLTNEGEGISGGDTGSGLPGDMASAVLDRGLLNENFLGETEALLGLVTRLEEVWPLVVFTLRFFILANSFLGRDDFFFGVGESVTEVEGHSSDSETESSSCTVSMRGIFSISSSSLFMTPTSKATIEA